MKVVLIAGGAQHGKDTSASILKNKFEQNGKRCLILRYGDYLKFLCKEHFGWDGNKDIIGRSLLQIYGTEKARDNNPDVWVNVVIETVKAFGKDYDYVLIPDFRYPNEHTRWDDNGFETFTIWVHRNDFDNGLTEEQKNHRSETALLDFNFDWIISVPSKIDKLQDALYNMLEQKKGFFNG